MNGGTYPVPPQGRRKTQLSLLLPRHENAALVPHLDVVGLAREGQDEDVGLVAACLRAHCRTASGDVASRPAKAHAQPPTAQTNEEGCHSEQ